jgi:hypothetical protein
MNRDDENWFDALAGKPNPDTAPATLQEATALRTVLQSKKATSAGEHKEVININSVQLLKERLRSEGLIPPAHSTSNAKRTIAASLAASLFICAGITLTLKEHTIFNDSESLNTYRGGEDIAAIVVADPKLSAQQLEQKLSAMNIQSQIQCDAGDCTIEAYIPSTQEETVNNLIKPEKKSVGHNGQLILKFSRQEK